MITQSPEVSRHQNLSLLPPRSPVQNMLVLINSASLENQNRGGSPQPPRTLDLMMTTKKESLHTSSYSPTSITVSLSRQPRRPFFHRAVLRHSSLGYCCPDRPLNYQPQQHPPQLQPLPRRAADYHPLPRALASSCALPLAPNILSIQTLVGPTAFASVVPFPMTEHISFHYSSRLKSFRPKNSCAILVFSCPTHSIKFKEAPNVSPVLFPRRSNSPGSKSRSSVTQRSGCAARLRL